MPIRSVTVYCSSSGEIDPIYLDEGAALGAAIAREGWALVYGGNDTGLMGRLAGAARNAGGKVIGVTPKLFVDKGVCDRKCDELIITDGMRDRKAMMEARGDAFVAMPGGLGTFEEIFEIIVGRQLAYHAKPIVLLNVAGFWDPLLEMFDRGIERKFIRPRVRELFEVCATADDAVKYLKAHQPNQAAAAVDLSFEVIPPAAVE